MASTSTSNLVRSSALSSTRDAVFSLLRPAAQCRRTAPAAAHFSTSPGRSNKDNNRNRGVSAVRSTGVRSRQTLSVRQKDWENQKLPTPVRVIRRPTGTPDHALWGFFKDQQLLQTPKIEAGHGRAWTVGELRSRDWNSLHQLWWVCVKERNRLATEKIERKRLDVKYGAHETRERDKTVQETMKAILDTLAERHQAYKEAHRLALKDPTIDFANPDGPRFIPPAFEPFEYEVEEEPQALQQAPQVDKQSQR